MVAILDFVCVEVLRPSQPSHLRYWNGTNLAILNLYVTPIPPTDVWAQSDLPLGSRRGLTIFKMATGYQNGKILATLNLYVAPMPPIKFQPYSTYGLGEDVV